MEIEEIVQTVISDFQEAFKEDFVSDNLSVNFDLNDSPTYREILYHLFNGAKCPINDFLGHYDCERKQIHISLPAISQVEYVGMTNSTTTLTNTLFHLIGQYLCSTITINGRQLDNSKFKALGKLFQIFTGQMFGYYSCSSKKKRMYSFIAFINVLTPEYASFIPFTSLIGVGLPLKDFKAFIEFCMSLDGVDQDTISTYFDCFIDEGIKELNGVHELLYPLLTDTQKRKYNSIQIIPKFF